MAKSDFCFTFYDGDAARDLQHMDRLARGGYYDIVLSQRKFGHLTLDFIKRILGKDFAEIWPQIEIICVKDEAGKFYIDWLENSEKRATAHSGKQSENGKLGGRPKKIKPTKSQTKPINKPTNNQKKPLGDGDGDGDGIGDEDVLGKGDEVENPFGKNCTFWDGWKNYKWEEHRQKYKAVKTEQAALDHLFKLSRGRPDEAVKIIQQSISNGWKGLFEVKETKNEHSKITKGHTYEGIQAEFNKRFGGRGSADGEPVAEAV